MRKVKKISIFIALAGYLALGFGFADVFADEIAGSLTDSLILMESPSDPDHESVGQNLMYWIDHVNRHLGMMEAMKGQLGLTGSAT